MRKATLLVLSLFCLEAARAQKEYFFYFQSEQAAPFYLKMGEQVYQANSEGYLILPRLRDSTYQLVIGKPGQQVPEARFSLPVNGRDRGFLVQEAEARLRLFDLQSLRAILPAEEPGRGGTSFVRKTDPFTRLLALAADDTSLLYVYTEPEKPKPADPPVVQKPETETIKDPVRTEPDVVVANPVQDSSARLLLLVRDSAVAAAATPIAADTLLTQATDAPPPAPDSTRARETVREQAIVPAKDTAVAQPETVQEPVISNTNVYKKSVVTRRSESSTTEGFGLVYLDQHEGGVDTIRLLIPNPKIVYQQPAASDTDENKKFLNLTNEAAVADTVSSAAPESVPARAACAATAGNADFLKLRRYMAAKEKEEDMVAEARRYFRNKCFSTEQVKNLSRLFLTDRGKYLFFETAFPRTTDPEQFAGLLSELEDAYFRDRFNVLTGK